MTKEELQKCKYKVALYGKYHKNIPVASHGMDYGEQMNIITTCEELIQENEELTRKGKELCECVGTEMMKRKELQSLVDELAGCVHVYISHNGVPDTARIQVGDIDLIKRLLSAVSKEKK